MRGVEVGDAKLADQPLILELLEEGECIEPCWIRKPPGVKLHQVDAIDLQALARICDGSTYLFPRDRAWLRHPLRQQFALRIRLAEVPRDQLGRSIVIGHVEGGESDMDIRLHCRRCRGRI